MIIKCVGEKQECLIEEWQHCRHIGLDICGNWWISNFAMVHTHTHSCRTGLSVEAPSASAIDSMFQVQLCAYWWVFLLKNHTCSWVYFDSVCAQVADADDDGRLIYSEFEARSKLHIVYQITL